MMGSKTSIEELRYTNRGYMYTTSPSPWPMDMIRVVLAKRLMDTEEGKMSENGVR
jgi:hypothetical protein